MLALPRVVVLAAGIVLMNWTNVSAGVFDCRCTNGTVCKISCGCSGSISCAKDDCSGSCGTCPEQGPRVMAETTAAALYRGAFIVTKGEFDEKRLTSTYARLLSGEGVSLRRINTPDGPYVTVTMQDDGFQSSGQLSHALHLPEQFYRNAETRKLMVDVVKDNAAKIVKRTDLDPNYLRQFFGQPLGSRNN